MERQTALFNEGPPEATKPSAPAVENDAGKNVANAITLNRFSDPSFIDMKPASQQGSITSLDEIFRQQNELDKSIAALRLFSTQTDYSNPPTSMIPETGRTTDYIGRKSAATTSFSLNPKSPS